MSFTIYLTCFNWTKPIKKYTVNQAPTKPDSSLLTGARKDTTEENSDKKVILVSFGGISLC